MKIIELVMRTEVDANIGPRCALPSLSTSLFLSAGHPQRGARFRTPANRRGELDVGVNFLNHRAKALARADTDAAAGLIVLYRRLTLENIYSNEIQEEKN